MVPVEGRNIKFIKGKEFFKPTYTLARINGFNNNDIKVGCLFEQPILVDCSQEAFNDLCYKAFDASLTIGSKQAYAVDMFIKYNAETLDEETLLKMNNTIKQVLSSVSRERASELRELNRYIGIELVGIRQLKKYYAKQKIKKNK